MAAMYFSKGSLTRSGNCFAWIVTPLLGALLSGGVLVSAAACAPTPGMTGPVPDDPPTDKPPVSPPEPPLFSHGHGFYDEPFDLVLGAPGENDTIRYTLDGRDPSLDIGTRSLEYDGPIHIETTTVIRVAIWRDGQPVKPTRTQTYLFARSIPQQAAPAEYPATWWEGDSTGPYGADYEIDPEVVGSSQYGDRFPGAFTAIPVVSIAMNPDDLFGIEGIYENPLGHGVEWERAGSAELFEKGRVDGFQIECGIRLQGGSGRLPERSPKKSFRLLFKEQYGATKLEYPLFPNPAVGKFDTLVLRAHYNRSWAHYVASQRVRAQYVREVFASDTQRAMGHVSPHARHVHLFLNGLYWGIYLVQERPDASFQSQYFGGDKEEYDAINTNYAIDGDQVAWDKMMALARTGLESAEAYEAMKQWLDIDNFIDYMLLNLYLGNVDWPDRNWYAARRRSADGRFRFFNWDAELTIRNLDDNFVDVDYPDSPGELFQRLRGNTEFRARFSERAAMHMNGTGALAPDVAIARWLGISSVVEPAIFAESARWGDHYRDTRGDATAELYIYSDHWVPERARIVERYLPFRRDIMIQQFTAAGLYDVVPAAAVSR